MSVCELFYLSLSSGKLISEWENANILLVFKKGKKSLTSSFCAISLLSILFNVWLYIGKLTLCVRVEPCGRTVDFQWAFVEDLGETRNLKEGLMY